MEERGREISVSSTGKTIPGERDRTLDAPRFDEKSIQRAQPAVPLARSGRAHRTWPTSVVVICVLAGLVGGMLGGLALTLYHRDNGARVESSPAVVAPVAPQATGNAPSVVESSPASTGAGTTPVREETNAAQDAPSVAPEQARREQPAPPDVQRASESAREVESVASVAAEGAGAKPTDAATQGELRSALDEWLAATNARDVRRQMQFYAPTMNAFYLSRNTSRDAVRAEKSRVFAQAETVDVRASSAPDIRLSRDGQTAVMRFRKRYQITGGAGARSGEVLQELRWRRTSSGWRIVSERDLRVIQ
jgi:ketosteroid isomerase-like protein